MGGRYWAINSPLGPRWGQKSLDLRSRDFCPHLEPCGELIAQYRPPMSFRYNITHPGNMMCYHFIHFHNIDKMLVVWIQSKDQFCIHYDAWFSPLWYCGQIISREPGQYHGCWYPCSFHPKVMATMWCWLCTINWLVFHKEGFRHPKSFECWEMKENENMVSCFLTMQMINSMV